MIKLNLSNQRVSFKHLKDNINLLYNKFNFEDEWLNLISEAVTVPLLELDLSKNNLDDECVKLICDALEYNNTLMKLDLSNNKITTQGEKYILET